MTQTAQPPLLAASVAPPTNSKDLMQFEGQKKSAGVAIFLCWLCGAFGGHRFYLGRPHGVTMLIITLLSIPLCFVLVGFLGLAATWVWMIVDLFHVSMWTRQYNTALLAKIQSGGI